MKQILKKTALLGMALLLLNNSVQPCTGITLKAASGAVVVSRTVEWALNDASHNRILVVPRNKSFRGQ
ncbi:MAG: choloylglycine hydrolase, partial [Bacteroidota bacterium]